MIIDGQAIADTICERVKKAIACSLHRPPGLAFILVGDNPASRSYIHMKKKKCGEVGILSFDKEFSVNISQETLLEEIQALNRNPQVDGILVQLPLPAHLKTADIIAAVLPDKDVDGFHPINIGKLLLGETDGFIPCTPYGIQVLLAQSHIPIQGKHVVIIGRSNIVGKPLAALLMQKSAHGNATVTIAHSFSEHLREISLSADILIAAMGKAKFVTADMVKKGAVVIDVGINREIDETGKPKIVGDVDFAHVVSKCSFITPVPKGVGPMTIAMLLSNTLLSYQRRLSRLI
ncbi:MAG: bifunctional methylenetetrahydrofolate dehydrogenase/methenyltetrahydrofolate cyclohydrolase FolD [Anaerolineae bacterium]